MRISDWSSDVCSSDLEAAPAGADVEQLQARPVEQQLGRQVPLLVRLRLIQALLAAAEVGAGILAVGVEEEVLELAGKVVVVGDVLLRLADRIILLQAADVAAKGEAELHQGIALEVGVVAGQSEEHTSALQ